MHTMTRRRIAVALVTLAVLAVAFPLTSTIDAQGARVNNGLLALYTFEEGSGTTVRDVSGSGDPLDFNTWVDKAYIDGMLAEGKRIMGFGHRVYKNFDPRARIIKRAADQVLAQLGVAEA